MLTSLFDCPKVIGFTSTTPYDWLEKLAPLFHPIRTLTMIRSKTKSTVAHCTHTSFPALFVRDMQLLPVLIGSLDCDSLE